MGITYSGGVLTQASEAGKTISAVASMTDGIRLTITSHGYSAGDAILITGTTSYNGDWIVSSVYDSNNIDIVSQYFPTGSALAYISSQTGTSAKGDKNLAALTGLTGVTVINSGTDKVIYSISSSVTTLNINGLLKIDPDKELLILSASTVVVQTGYFVYGKRYTLNGFTKYSSSLGIITEKSGYKDSTSSAHWWVKNGSTFRTFGGRMELAGCIYFGTDVTANDNTIYIDIGNGEKTEFYCTNAENNLTHILRIFAVASNVKVNIILSGNITPDCVFSTNGFNAFSAELRLASFICDANDKATDPVTVTDAVFANNKADRDYSFQIALHSSTHLGLLTRMNKYIFINPDVGSLLRTFPAPDPSWDTPRMGCVEIYRAVKFVLTDSSGNAISAFRIYTEFVGASLNPASGSRYYGIDDYVTPRTLNVVGSSGETTPTNVLYAVAQGYTNTPYDTALTMDSLTSNANDAQTFFTVAYGFLSSLLSSSLRGIGTLSKSGTILPDVGITQATKATVAGYTGLSPVYSGGVLTITVSANHTWNEVYDYIKYWESENPASVWANDKTSFVSTSNKLSYVYSNLVVVVDGYDLITSALQVLPTKPTVSSGGFFEDAEGAIWESSGSIYYASHYYGHVVAVEDSADLEAVAIGYGDCATGTYLLYDMDLTLTGLVTDADGLAEGYMVWKVNSTTYADKA
jgi:hypothetical protein